MSSGKTQNLENKPIVVILSLIASCIGIFVFVTGKQNISAIFGSSTPITNASPAQRDTNTPFPSELPEAPLIASATARPTIAPPASPPKTIDFDNPAVSIVLKSSEISDGNGMAHFEFQADNTPLRDISLLFVPAVIDIAGRWTSGYEAGTIYKTDPNGVIEVALEPGNYAALNRDAAAVWNKLMGNWGIQGSNSNGRLIEMIVFPIEAGKTTEITVELSILEIGLISTNGDALKNKLIYVHCQGKDIAGNIIPSDRCKWNEQTDIAGLATFYLGSGTYFIRVYNFPKNDVYFYDISLDVGETRREIFNIP
jgi:hypothetical protein